MQANSVQVYNSLNSEWLGPFGVLDHDGDTVGIAFQDYAPGSTVPSYPGGSNAALTWVQLLNNSQIEYLESSGDVPEPAETNALDLVLPIGFGDYAHDYPAVQLLDTDGEAWRTFTATTYLMWDPGLGPPKCLVANSITTRNEDGSVSGQSYPSECTSSIPIPLASVTWHWSGCAINTLITLTEPDKSKSPWLLSTSNGCPIQTPGTPATTTTFPTWQTVGD